MENIIKNVISVLCNILMKLAGIMGARGKNSLMCSMCEAYSNTSDEYVSFKKRSKYSKDMIINHEINKEIEDVCILLQGPIKKENDFTIETIKFYRELYPKCFVIVSTWNDEEKKSIDKLKEVGAMVIQSEKPQKTGLGNMNFQLISTKAGINYAEKNNIKYILKTRTDQRLGKNNFLEYLLGLIECFKIKDDYLKLGVKERIIVHQGSTGGNMFVPYFISDFLYFGTTKDIKKLFSLDLDEKSMSYKERGEWIDSLCGKTSVEEYYNKTAPEIKIIKSYIEKYSGKKVENSVKAYWDFVKNYLVCVSWDDIGLFWFKYNYQNESDIFHLYEERDNNKRYLQYNWTFQNWFNLYNEKIEYSSNIEKIKNEVSY